MHEARAVLYRLSAAYQSRATQSAIDAAIDRSGPCSKEHLDVVRDAYATACRRVALPAFGIQRGAKKAPDQLSAALSEYVLEDTVCATRHETILKLLKIKERPPPIA